MDLLTSLDDRIREIVREELAKGARSSLLYSSNELPPGVTSRATFARRCRTIPEAAPSGRGWTCPVAAWEADARARLDRRRRRTPAASSAPSNVVSIAHAIVAGSSRGTR